jgi:hypothetical protein
VELVDRGDAWDLNPDEQGIERMRKIRFAYFLKIMLDIFEVYAKWDALEKNRPTVLY